MHNQGGGVGHTTQAAIDSHFLTSAHAPAAPEDQVNDNNPTQELTIEEINELARFNAPDDSD